MSEIAKVCLNLLKLSRENCNFFPDTYAYRDVRLPPPVPRSVRRREGGRVPIGVRLAPCMFHLQRLKSLLTFGTTLYDTRISACDRPPTCPMTRRTRPADVGPTSTGCVPSQMPDVGKNVKRDFKLIRRLLGVFPTTRNNLAVGGALPTSGRKFL